ncbi:MAG: hypothetical protein LH660_08000, partial [Phormidesmis sp. CAN_BIN36]|nr:hypothetical protein [Phormidesmis sp. CAN_BIN36]
MNRQIRPHPSPLPKGEETRLLSPFSLGRGVGEGFAPFMRRAFHTFIQQRPNSHCRKHSRLR